MTEELKKQLRDGVDAIADSLYNVILQSYEMVEKDMPADVTESQKQAIFTSIFNSCFESQKQMLDSTMRDVKSKITDKAFVASVAKEVKNV